MKIIDLLNKKANGEKLPEIIIIDGERYYLQNMNDLEELYINAGNNSWTRVESIILNDEIEVIEEPKKIEKIKIPEIDDIKNKRIVDIEFKINEIIERLGENNEF